MIFFNSIYIAHAVLLYACTFAIPLQPLFMWRFAMPLNSLQQLYLTLCILHHPASTPTLSPRSAGRTFMPMSTSSLKGGYSASGQYSGGGNSGFGTVGQYSGASSSGFGTVGQYSGASSSGFGTVGQYSPDSTLDSVFTSPKDEEYNVMVARQMSRQSDPLYASIPDLHEGRLCHNKEVNIKLL